MAKKRINKKPSRGHQYSYAGFMEFLQNNPEVLAIAQEAMSNDNRNTYAAIAPVNRTGKEPAITTNNSIYNRELKDKEYPTFKTQQTATNTEGLPFASTIKKLDDITNTLKESVDINRPLVEQKMGIPKSVWSKYYDAGGTMAAIDGGMSLLSNFARDFKGLDLRKQKAELNEIANREVAASSNDELLDSYNDIRNLKHVGLHDITGGSYLTDVLGGLGRNAGAFWTGFQTTGNWYAAAAIAAADAASQIFGFGKKKRQVKKSNEDIDWANVRQYANVDNVAKNLAYTNTSSVLDNYMQGMDGPGFYTGAYGGPIHIADSKKGTFTAAATKHGMGVQEFASKVLANKEDYSPAMVKKANFARNASHWHDYGGNMYNKNDLHNLGIKIGQTINNLSNLGEYEFMNRKVHPNGRVEWYYPSDNYTSWGELPVPHVQRKYDVDGWNYASGGNLYDDDFTNGVTFVNTGGTHEQNPFEGVQMGIAPDGKPNLVEEGEVIYNDYVFSNRLRVPKAVREKYKLRGPKDMTFAQAFKSAQRESEERPNDPISKKGLENSAAILAASQEALKQEEEQKQYMRALGGNLFRNGGNTNNPKKKKNNAVYSVEEKVGDLEGASLHYIIENLIDHPVTTARALRERSRRRKEKEFSGFGGGSFRGAGAGGTWTSGSVEEAIERSKEEAMKDKIIYSPGTPVETTTKKSFGEIYREHELAGDTGFWLDGVYYLVQNDPNVKLGKKRYHNVTKSVPVVIREVEDSRGTVIPDSTASSIYTGQMLGKFDRAEDPNEVANRINGLPYYNGEVGFNGLKALGGHLFGEGASLLAPPVDKKKKKVEEEKKAKSMEGDTADIETPHSVDNTNTPVSGGLNSALLGFVNDAFKDVDLTKVSVDNSSVEGTNGKGTLYDVPGYYDPITGEYTLPAYKMDLRKQINDYLVQQNAAPEIPEVLRTPTTQDWEHPSIAQKVAAAVNNTTNPKNKEGDDSERNNLSALRYFSTLANAGAVLTDALGLTNRPTVFDKIKGPALVRAPRLGNYLPVMNLDTRYESNVLAQQANATRNALMQSIAPSRAANILAADALAQSKMGELMRNAELANYDLAVKRAEYNRDTDKTNAQYNFAAAVENAKNKMANASELLKQAKMNDEAETLAWAAKAQNIKTLADNISNIGREKDALSYRDMFIKMGPTLADYMRPTGWSDEEWAKQKEMWAKAYADIIGTNKVACGGKISRKKRRGLTY